MADTPEGIFLQDAPSDSISSITFSRKSSRYLLTTAWDGSCRLYNPHEGRLVTSCMSTASSPLLDGCFGRYDDILYAAGIDGALTQFDLAQGETRARCIGLHEGGVSNVRFDNSTNSIISSSWDGSIRTWDPRSSRPEVARYNQEILRSTLLPASKVRIFNTVDEAPCIDYIFIRLLYYCYAILFQRL